MQILTNCRSSCILDASTDSDSSKVISPPVVCSPIVQNPFGWLLSLEQMNPEQHWESETQTNPLAKTNKKSLVRLEA